MELKSFYRERDQVVFTFALPVVLLVLLGTVFDNVYPDTTVTSAHYMVPSMMAAGIASATFLNLGTSIAADRENGTLERLRGTADADRRRTSSGRSPSSSWSPSSGWR